MRGGGAGGGGAGGGTERSTRRRTAREYRCGIDLRTALTVAVRSVVSGPRGCEYWRVAGARRGWSSAARCGPRFGIGDGVHHYQTWEWDGHQLREQCGTLSASPQVSRSSYR